MLYSDIKHSITGSQIRLTEKTFFPVKSGNDKQGVLVIIGNFLSVYVFMVLNEH